MNRHSKFWETTNPSAWERLGRAAARLACTNINTTSTIVHPINSLLSLHLVQDHLFYHGYTAVDSACSLCRADPLPAFPDLVSAPRAQAPREHRMLHVEHLLFECPVFWAWPPLW